MAAPLTQSRGAPNTAEARWAPIVLVIVMLVGLELMPLRQRLLPNWAPYLAAAFLLVPMLGVQLSRANVGWKRVEGIAVYVFVIFAGVLNIALLARLVGSMLFHTHEIEPIQLLASAVAVWVLNVFTFTLLYWRVDGGGPEARLVKRHPLDFTFSQPVELDGAHHDWHPSFVDYLFLAFTDATAFSPTDSLPITPRAKLMMMFESSLSLVALALVAARAINILR